MRTPLVDLGIGALPGARSDAGVLVKDPSPPPGRGPEFGEASPVALVVILLMGIVTVFLIRGMAKHIRRLPASFDPPEPERPARTDEEKAEPSGNGKS